MRAMDSIVARLSAEGTTPEWTTLMLHDMVSEISQRLDGIEWRLDHLLKAAESPSASHRRSSRSACYLAALAMLLAGAVVTAFIARGRRHRVAHPLRTDWR